MARKYANFDRVGRLEVFNTLRLFKVSENFQNIVLER